MFMPLTRRAWTPLHDAADAPCVDAFEALLDNGTVANATNKAGDTALHLAARGESLHNVELLLDNVRRRNRYECYK